MIRNTKTTIRTILLGTAILSVWAVFGLNDAEAGTILQRPLYFGLTQGLVGQWSFDEQDMAGVTSYDRSGQGNNGTLTNGPTRQIGKIGQALNFDGVDDYVSLTNIASTRQTLSAWVFHHSNPAGVSPDFEDVILYKGDDDGDGFWGIYLGVNSFEARIDVTGTDTDTFCGHPTAVPLNRWTHVAATLDGPNNTVTVYVDGIPFSCSVTGVTTHADAWAIGHQPGATPGYEYRFDGLIDEVRIYNRALSADEIKRLYNIGATTKFNVSKKQDPSLNQGLVGLWTFDAPDMAGVAAYDRSGNNNTGTLTNGPTRQIGKIGQALNFDGSNDYVSLPSQTDTNAYTQSVWIYMRSSGRFIFANDNGNQWCNTASTAVWYTRITSSCGATRDDLNLPALIANRWTHLVFVYDGVQDDKFIYKDGVLSASKTSTSHGAGSLALTGKTHLIGDSNDGTSFNGLIDDVRVYNRVLSADEIKRLYNMGATTKFNSSQKNQLTNGLVGYWSFDGPDMAGVTSYDRSGQGNNGTLTNGPTRALGKIGQALNFDGVDDYVDAGSGASLNPGGSNFTISAWIKSKDTAGAIVCKDNQSTSDCNTNTDFYILEIVSGEAQFQFSSGDAGSTATANGTSLVNNDQWHHIVGVRSGPKTAELYVDGIRQATATHTGSWTGIDSTSALFIGTEEPLTNFLSGLIDEVRVYNRALSPDEIKRLYNMGR